MKYAPAPLFHAAAPRTVLALLAGLSGLLSAVDARAQGIDVLSNEIVRTVPATAKPAMMSVGSQAMTVVLDGKLEQLAPGAHIRDARRRLVLPASLGFLIGGQSVKVAVERDMGGRPLRIWMLEPR